MFVDGRYTLQAKIQSGKYFKIITLPKKLPLDFLGNKKISIGFDPKLHTEATINHFFKKNNCMLIPLEQNLIDKIWIKKNIIRSKKFYKLKDKSVGESSTSKIKKLIEILNDSKADLQFISASENVAWLLNLRGADSEFVPIPNSYLILDNKNKIYLFCDLKKVSKKLKKNLSYVNIMDINFIKTIFCAGLSSLVKCLVNL